MCLAATTEQQHWLSAAHWMMTQVAETATRSQGCCADCCRVIPWSYQGVRELTCFALSSSSLICPDTSTPFSSATFRTCIMCDFQPGTADASTSTGLESRPSQRKARQRPMPGLLSSKVLTHLGGSAQLLSRCLQSAVQRSPLLYRRGDGVLVLSETQVYGSKQHRVAYLFYPVVKLDKGLLEVKDVRVLCFLGQWTEL